MNPKVIRDLKYSPSFIADILYAFIEGSRRIDERGAKFELIYLVVPFVMDDILRDKLSRSKASSTFQTAFLKNDEIKERLFFINNKVLYSKSVTNDGIIYLSSMYETIINSFILIKHEEKCLSNISDYKKEFLKASYNLGIIFSKEGYVNVLLKSKVKNI
ncbi:TPA: three component ABC system middle component [Photobacterium damselae]